MDFHMKHESELEPEAEQQYPCAKMPKHNLHQYYDHPSVSALPLFVPEPKISTSYNTDLSALPDATATVSKLPPPRTGGSYFSLAQWQELELQALIYRYMLAGAAVPPELLQPIKKSLLLSHSYAPPYFLHHPLHHFQPAWYWGRLAMDPEPGRCRRTDGKKWRCSRDVVGGHKYCERHMHRGRNRSRKPVETPTPAAAAAARGGGAGTPVTAIPMSAPLQRTVAGENHFSLSGPSPSADLLNLSQSYAHSKHENKSLFHTQNEVTGNERSDGHVLRHFFDDWPRSMEADGSGSNGGSLNFTTSLSISMPTNSSSDVSLKLSTGVGDEHGSRNGEHESQVVNWGSGWASSNHVSSMGGPLAEALRSSTNTSSPTSVLHHQLPRNSVSDTSFVSA